MDEKSPRKKRILILTSGNIDHPSSRTRALQFVPYLENENYYVAWIPRVPVEPKNGLRKFIFPISKRYYYLKTRLFIIFGSWHLILVQRAYLEKVYLELAKSRKVPIVFDFDDALYLHENDKKGNISFTGLMIQYAEAVIISTPYLSSFCESNGKTPFVIPTSVDGEIIKPNLPVNQKAVPVVGWIGSNTTTVVIKEAEEGLRRLAHRMDYRLLLVGANKNYKPTGIPFEHHTWSLEKEAFFLSEMDVGIMPLLLTEYSKGKGGFKLYLYMAAAIPSVATPIGVNTEVILDGVNGFHASNPEEWDNRLFELLNSPHLREKMGIEGRKLFEKNYSVVIAFGALNNIISAVVNTSQS